MRREQKFPSAGVEMPVGEREDTGKTDHLGIYISSQGHWENTEKFLFFEQEWRDIIKWLFCAQRRGSNRNVNTRKKKRKKRKEGRRDWAKRQEGRRCKTNASHERMMSSTSIWEASEGCLQQGTQKPSQSHFPHQSPGSLLFSSPKR